MNGNAALLIDLENFFLARETTWRAAHPDEPYDFSGDLDFLSRFAEQIAAGKALSVRRAYADYNVARKLGDEERWDFYLRSCPKIVMEQGIEPVQVFRFPGGSRKNAADMRLAMDATSIISGSAPFDLFVLVTGDSDFIPLVLELKARGARVVVIGVEGHTKLLFQRYCDDFEFFEDLVAADAIAGGESDIEPVREALQKLLERRRPIHFAGVKPLLGKVLERPFDPLRFDCETTGEFLRRFEQELGVSIVRGEHDWMVDLSGERPETTPSPLQRTPRHTSYEYRFLLRMRNPRIHLVPHGDWLRITELFFDYAGGPADCRPVVLHSDLVADVTEQCAEDGMEAADKKVQATVFQLFKSGAFVCAVPGEEGVTDFHWSKQARLAEEIDELEDFRDLARLFIARLLLQRLRAEFGVERAEPSVYVELLEGPEPDPERVAALEGLLERAGEGLDGAPARRGAARSV